MRKAVVLLSGGLDSTVNLYRAHKEMEIILALSFNYGQRAERRELEAAKYFANQLNVPWQTIDLSWFSEFTKTSLVNREAAVPVNAQVGIDDQKVSEASAKAVWVPNRNGIFLNIAAGFAEGLQADLVIPGFNKEEAATFPDNSSDYCQALNESFSFSTANQIEVKSFTQEMDKTEIVKMALELNVPLAKVWPCYFADEYWCGQCESCQRLTRALQDNGVDLEEMNF